MKGILLHGGHGTRLRPLTHTGPKQLLPIANRPMSEYCIESMRDAGVTEIAIIVGGIGSNKVKEYYGTGEKFGVKITYVEQDSPRGISHAIRLCKEFIDDDKFLVFLGDNIIQISISKFTKEFQESDAAASIFLCKVENPSRFGIADIQNGKIMKIMEKPEVPPTDLAVTGIYLLTPIIFQVIDRLKPSWRNELEITDALQMLLEEGHKITYNMITDYWKDTGTPEDIIHANMAILEKMKPYFHGKMEDNVTTSGTVMVGDNTIIKKGVTLTGPIIIGKNCVIDSNANLGPNISIGDNSKLSNCIINNSIIMNDCTINGKIKITKSIIAASSDISFGKDDQNDKVFLLGEGTKITL
jgi:glucose-1-phosphate thymidylyltransferase